jgi:uncharacterized membrane protein
MNEQKSVDLKALLDKIKQISDTSPDLAKQMMDEFVRQSQHVRDMDRIALEAQIRVTYLGQFFGLIIGLTAIISGAVIATQGAQWAGGFIGGGGVIGLVSVFVLGRRKA